MGDPVKVLFEIQIRETELEFSWWLTMKKDMVADRHEGLLGADFNATSAFDMEVFNFH